MTERVRNVKKSLRKILAPMSWKERIDYLWTYYKFHFIIPLVLIVTIVMMIQSIAEKKDIVLNVMILGERIDMEKIDKLTAELNLLMVKEEDFDEMEVAIRVVPYSPTATDPQVQQAALQKMIVEVAAGTIDILVIDQGQFDRMNREEGYFSDIRYLAGERDLAFDESDVYYSPGNKVTGIDVSAITILKDGIQDPDRVLCFLSNGPNVENAKKFLSYMLDNQK